MLRELQVSAKWTENSGVCSGAANSFAMTFLSVD